MKFSTDNDKYPKFPPLLFPDKHRRDMKRIFRSVELTKVRFKYLGSIHTLIDRLDA